jgi:hypothetical protein
MIPPRPPMRHAEQIAFHAALTRLIEEANASSAREPRPPK